MASQGHPIKTRPSSYLFRHRFAKDDFAEHQYGALAQLGERLICIQEVSGSIPLGSTMVWRAFLDNHCRTDVTHYGGGSINWVGSSGG